MLNLDKQNNLKFGLIQAEDDQDIEIHHLRKEEPPVRRNGGIGSVVGEIGLFARDIIFALTLAVLVGVFIVQPVAVEGTSMLPELHDGERLLVNKLIYYKIPYLQDLGWPSVERGDVVVFWFPNDPDKSFVKRVIGLPGETVEVRNGVIYVNGKLLDEPYLDPSHNMNHANHSPKRVEQHYYYVVGDNRDNSYDSRSWGLVPEKYIYGKALFRYWPLSDFGFIARSKSEENNQTNKRPQSTDVPR